MKAMDRRIASSAAQQQSNTQKQEQQQQQQQQQSRGGGDGGGRRGGSDGMSPEEISRIFARLAEASGLFFKDRTTFLMTEESANILLAGAFQHLAKATLKGQLEDAVNHFLHSARDELNATIRAVGSPMSGGWMNLPVFGENAARRVVGRMRGKLFPDVPD